MNRDFPETEAIAESYADLDGLDCSALVERLVLAQRDVVDAVLAQRGEIAHVVRAVVERLERGGRLHYAGAGTSGRLAMLDAAEIPPTFGAEPDLVHAHVAGGANALVRAVENAEDNAMDGERAVYDVGEEDAVIGLSASGGARYVVAALNVARARGAFTAAITSNAASPVAQAAEAVIVLRTGAEPVAGSTRMRAGTAQKIVLNTISTAAMILLGKVYQNLMVDVVATNRKLRDRALRLVERLAEVDATRAAELLHDAGESVKVAVVMAKRDLDATEARALLDRNHDRLRDVL